ncbi:MAG: RNA polymerase sigma-54 factor [Deltaproteobacteria bacterium]|nr:MAG: RNA polymerase sigma-54 factor [Deltaproteobacteria bacterium]
MALELRQQLKLTQQLIMTPQLQMAIKLLQLTRLELLSAINQELEENPTLEEEIHEADVDEYLDEQTESKAVDLPDTKEVRIEEKIRDDIDWSNYIDEYSSSGRVHFETEKKESPNFELFVARDKSLREHLLWQLLMTSPTEEEEKIGSIIAGNLKKDGYLDASVEDIVQMSGVNAKKVEEILSLMQTFDPIGICARNLSECLLIQAKHFDLDNTIVTQIIKQHLNHLENKNYKAIAKSLKANIEDVIAAINVIKNLEPRPGRQFTDEQPQYINPDVFVYKVEDEFIIWVNDDGMPKLHINNFYRNAIRNSKKFSNEAKNYVQEKMRSATWLIRSIHQRQKTIYRVMESILKFQLAFFEKGISYLKPMVLRDVAEDIGMHESTISRVTTNKYAHTPRGIFELKYFFNSSIQRFHGEAMASASVQDKIRQIIESEDKKKPYSDDKISELLKENNISIARRTVAKYREIMGILPSNKRKQF